MARIGVITFVVCVFIFINGVQSGGKGDGEETSTGSPNQTPDAATDDKEGEVPENEGREIKIKQDGRFTQLSRIATLKRTQSEIIFLNQALDNIDLNTYPAQSVTYYKNALLLYTRILDFHFFKERPSYSSLKQLEKFSETEGKEAELLSIGASVINEYEKNIVTKDDYLKKATYFRALKWIQIQTDEKPPILQVTSAILVKTSKRRKARNYLYDVLNSDKRVNWFNWLDGNLKKFKGWEEPNENDEALKFCEQMAISKGTNALEVDTPITDLNVYDRILNDANDRVFKMIFNLYPYEMIRLLDHVFHLKYKKNQIQERSVYRKATPEDEINLNTMTDDNMKLYKHASILFAAAFQKTFELNFITESTHEEIVTLPVLYTEIRYRSFLDVMCKLPEEMTAIIETMDEVGGLFSFSNKAYLYWLVEWYQRKVYNREYDKYKELEICLHSLLESTKTTHILNELYNPNFVTTLIDKEATTTVKLSHLLELGQDVNNLLSTIMAYTLDESVEKYEEAKASSYEQQLKDNPTEESEKTLKTYENVIQDILHFGLPETLLKFNRKVYKSLIANINVAEFERKFLIPFSTIRDKIEKKLKNEKNETSERGRVRRSESMGG